MRSRKKSKDIGNLTNKKEREREKTTIVYKKNKEVEVQTGRRRKGE